MLTIVMAVITLTIYINNVNNSNHVNNSNDYNDTNKTRSVIIMTLSVIGNDSNNNDTDKTWRNVIITLTNGCHVHGAPPCLLHQHHHTIPG